MSASATNQVEPLMTRLAWTVSLTLVAAIAPLAMASAQALLEAGERLE
jgi:hypothetical protein